MSNKRISLLVIIVSVVGILITIQEIILGVVINSKFYHSMNENLLNNFGINWGQGQINSISVNSQDSCGVLSKNALVNIFFPGFRSGCYCQNSGYFYEECSSLQLAQGCKNFPETKPKLLSSWGGHICTSRPLNQTYFTMIKTNDKCKENYKKCGVLDSFNSTLCVESNIECPVNKIEIISAKNNTNNNDNVLNLSNNKKLVFNNDNLNGIIANQFLITDHTPCSNPSDNKIQLTESKEYCLNTIGEHKYDYSWKLLDTMTLDNLTEDNDLSAQVSQYPFWEKIKNKNVYLYYRNYIGVSDECINYGKQFINSDTLNEFPTLLLNTKTEAYQKDVDFISVISITIYIFLLIGYIIKILLICTETKLAYNLYVNVVIAMSSLVLFIVSSISSGNILFIRNNYLWMTKITNCLDSLNTLLLLEMDSSFRDSYNIGIIFVIFALILFLLTLFEGIAKACIEEEDDEDREIYQNDENENSSSNKNKIINNTESEHEDLLKKEDQTVEMSDMNKRNK